MATIDQDIHNKIEDNHVRHLEQEHQTVSYQYDELGRVIKKQIQINALPKNLVEVFIDI